MATSIVAYLVIIAAVGFAAIMIVKRIRKKRKTEKEEDSGKKTEKVTTPCEIKSEKLSNTSFKTFLDFLNSDPVIGKDGLPLQQELNLPTESVENKKLCDKAMYKVESGMAKEALRLYAEAGRNGSARGKLMSVLLLISKIGEPCEEELPEAIEWLVDLAYKSKHPLGIGLGLIYTAIMYPDTFDGLSEEEIKERQDDVISDFNLAVNRGDFIAHYLLISFYEGCFESTVPEFLHEDIDMYVRAVMHFTRYYNLFILDKTLGKEFSFILDKDLFVKAFGHLSYNLNKSGKYFEAITCGKKALEIARLDNEKNALMELVAAQIARAYTVGNGTEVDLKQARKYLLEALRFKEDKEENEYTKFVSEELFKKETALKRLDDIVKENRSRSYFDMEEFSQKLAAFNEKLEADRALEEQKREAQRLAEEEKAKEYVPPLKGKIEVRGNDEYFVTDEGSAYKLYNVSKDKSEITVYRGYLYGMQTYKVRK